MKKIIEYRILEADSAERLEGELVRVMNLGWQPLGGVSTRFRNQYVAASLIQAMVKYEEV